MARGFTYLGWVNTHARGRRMDRRSCRIWSVSRADWPSARDITHQVLGMLTRHGMAGAQPLLGRPQVRVSCPRLSATRRASCSLKREHRRPEVRPRRARGGALGQEETPSHWFSWGFLDCVGRSETSWNVFWWSWGESNPRPKAIARQIYMLSW